MMTQITKIENKAKKVDQYADTVCEKSHDIVIIPCLPASVAQEIAQENAYIQARAETVTIPKHWR